MCKRCADRYPAMSRLMPRSKSSVSEALVVAVVVEEEVVEEEDEVGCWIKKEREGTVARYVGEAGVTKRDSGRVRWPACRAEMRTYVCEGDAGGRAMNGEVVGEDEDEDMVGGVDGEDGLETARCV